VVPSPDQRLFDAFGLSLSGTGAFDVYSILYFDNVSASFNGYQRILDFQNCTSDSGLYSHNGSLQLFATSGSGDPSGGTAGQVFTNGRMADLLVTRDAAQSAHVVCANQRSAGRILESLYWGKIH